MLEYKEYLHLPEVNLDIIDELSVDSAMKFSLRKEEHLQISNRLTQATFEGTSLVGYDLL